MAKKIKLQIRMAVIFNWLRAKRNGLGTPFDGEQKKPVLLQATHFHGSPNGHRFLAANDWCELVGMRVLFVPPLDDDWDTLAWTFDSPKNRGVLEHWLANFTRVAVNALPAPVAPVKINRAPLPRLDVKQLLNPRHIFVERPRSRRPCLAVAS